MRARCAWPCIALASATGNCFAPKSRRRWATRRKSRRNCGRCRPRWRDEGGCGHHQPMNDRDAPSRSRLCSRRPPTRATDVSKHLGSWPESRPARNQELSMNQVAVEVTRLKHSVRQSRSIGSESRYLDCYGSWPQLTSIFWRSGLSMNRSAGFQHGALAVGRSAPSRGSALRRGSCKSPRGIFSQRRIISGR